MCQSKANGGKRCKGQRSVKKISSNDVAQDLLHTYLTDSIAAYHSTKTEENAQEHWRIWSEILSLPSPSLVIRKIMESDTGKLYPELFNVFPVQQDEYWHPEGNVGEHLLQATDVAATLARQRGFSSEKEKVVILGALCHDLGKVTHTRYHRDGRITSQGHDLAGVPLAESFVQRIGGSKEVAHQVGVLVKTHMRHVNNPTVKSVRKLKDILAAVGLTLEDWAVVADADCGGRGSASHTTVGKQWLMLDHQEV